MKTPARLCLLIVITSPSVAWGAPPVNEGETRLVAAEQSLDVQLQDARRDAQLWHWSWVGLFSASMGAQGVLAAVVDDRDVRVASGLAAIPPAVGLTLQFVTAVDALDLEADLAALPTDPEARVAGKRLLLRRYAASEARQRNWFAHVGPIFLNALVAGGIWWLADDPQRAALQLGIGIAVSELRVWTSPQAATNALRGGGRLTGRAVRVAPVLMGRTAGVQLRF